MINTEKIKKNAEKSFKDDIKNFIGFQWVTVSDAKAAIAFAISETLNIKEKEEQNSICEILNDVEDALLQANQFNLEVEVIGFALLALKADPSLTISRALEIGLEEWIK